MEGKDKLLELAIIDFQGENFSGSYEKYSKILESETSNKEAWVFKGLSAAYLASPSEKGFKEAEVCLKQATTFGINEPEKNLIAEHIILSTKKFLDKIQKLLDAAAIESEKKPMATGELYSVRNIGLLADKLTALVNQWGNFKTSIQFCETSLLYLDTADQAKKVLGIIDIIFEKSTKHGNVKYVPELESMRNRIVSKISSKEPNFSPPTVNKSSDGCFIATAVYGNYDAPEVIELRNFRDSVLKKTEFGRKFIKKYYQWSPSLANFIKSRPILRKFAFLLFVLPPSLIWRFLKNQNN